MRKILILLLLINLNIISIVISIENLDLREANVTNVQIEKVSNGYRFDVTLIHDDDGEDGYADFWQVEALNGTILGKRILTHSHGTVEFTRSELIPIIIDKIVVVRGHDQTHGFGGQVALVNMTDFSFILHDQGTDKKDFSNITEIIRNGSSSIDKSNIESTSENLSFISVFEIIMLVTFVSIIILKRNKE